MRPYSDCLKIHPSFFGFMTTGLILSFVSVFGFSFASFAQIRGDDTVLTGVDFDGQNYAIHGGTVAGDNLFHSFSEFSILRGQEAFFENSASVANIIARVTGISKSNINGAIHVNCCANLFFINPNGIIFGSNAFLDIGGSFFGSTASEIIFSDRLTFSASSPNSSSLLSLSIPSGLNFRTNPSAILVQGLGHNVQANLDIFVQSGLKVANGQTLALVGGDVNLEGGILNAPSGTVEIGSVNSGVVTLRPISQGWRLNYDQVASFQDITLSMRSLVDASGFREGHISFQGKNIALSDGSLLSIEHNGFQSQTNIDLKATESINIIGSAPSPTGLVPSAVFIRNIGNASGGNISISAQSLLLKQGGAVSTYSVGSGKGGDISVLVSDSVQLIESLGLQDQSQISTLSFGFGGSGNLMLSTKYLKLLNGGGIGSQTFGSGNSGDVNVKASESVLLSGAKPGLVTTISSVTGGSGNSGSLTIDTQKLEILDGANINTSTFSEGNAGDLTINASNSVLLSGLSTNFSRNPLRSALASGALFVPIFTSNPPSGSTGNLIVNTPKLTIADGASINISHAGTGDAGNLVINAGSVFLNREGRITAETSSGLGGNININLNDILSLRNNSFISANSNGTGDGGNIQIKTPILVALPPIGSNGSDIVAKANRGNGGNIVINSKGVFGIEQRKANPGNQTNDIDASSQFGQSGQVQISTTTDPNQGLIELPATVVDPSTLVAQNPCKQASSSEFTRSGRGGLPPSLSQDLNGESTQVGLVEPANLSAAKPEPQPNSTQVSSLPLSSSQIAPAKGWVYNDKGEVVLVAYNSAVTGPQRLQSNPKGCPVF
jgi:filamentous hemagglutinin family protein